MKSMSIGALIAIVVALVPDALAHFSQYVPPARNICNLDPRWGRSGGAGQGVLRSICHLQLPYWLERLNVGVSLSASARYIVRPCRYLVLFIV